MGPPGAPRFAALLLALACGSGDAEAPRAPPPGDLGTELAAARLEVATLRQALSEEQAERQALELEVERLHEEMEQLAWSDEPPGTDESAGDSEPARDGGGDEERPWFDADALLEAGVQPAEIEAIREAFDESELALLELENRARREGWYRDARYRLELRDMRLALRAELGDDRFDRLLYASGRQNRVVVGDVLHGSPAAASGVEPGDEILSYAERRIFRGTELRHATTEGRAGDRTPLEVLRDGSRVRLWVPRGPLGIRMRQTRRPPPW